MEFPVSKDALLAIGNIHCASYVWDLLDMVTIMRWSY